MTAANGSEDAKTYRASSGPIVLGGLALLGIFLLGDAVVRGSWGQMLLFAPWVLLALWIIYEISFVSAIRVDADGVVVQNMLRRTSFGWRQVRDIDMRWQLVFSLADGADLVAAGGPARARPVRKPTSDEDTAKVPAGIRDLTELRDRWEAAPTTADAPIRRSWDGPALIALGVIAVWAVIAILIAQG